MKLSHKLPRDAWLSFRRTILGFRAVLEDFSEGLEGPSYAGNVHTPLARAEDCRQYRNDNKPR